MRKNKARSGVFLGCLIAAGLTAASSANAENNQPSLFVGANVGYQLADDDNYKYSDPGAFVGGVSTGIHFNDFWRWDLGFQISQSLESKENGIVVQPQWWETGLRYDWELPQDFKVYTRLGMAYWDMDKEIKHSRSLSASGVSPLIEVGVGYAITSRISIDGGIKYIDQIGDKLTGQYDSSSFNINLNYRFADNTPNIEEAVLVQDTVVAVEAPVLPKIETVAEQTYNLQFKFASSTVNIDSTKLMEVLDVLLEHPNSRVVLIGHTDATGSQQANFFLSEKRANNVAAYLESHGIDSSRIEAKGVGESSPIASNATAEGRRKNIRVDMIIPEYSYELTSEFNSAQIVN